MIEFNIPLFQVFTLLAAVVFPLLVGLVTKRETNPGRKAVLLAGLAVLISLCTELAAALQTGATYNLGMALLTGLGSFLVAVAMHYGLWKPTGVAEKLQDIGSGNAAEPNHSFVVDGNVQHVTMADIDTSKLGRSSGPHVRFDTGTTNRLISFDTDPDLSGEVDIYANGEKIGVAPIINHRVLYELPELPAGENKVIAAHPERGQLYRFTFDSEPGEHVTE